MPPSPSPPPLCMHMPWSHFSLRHGGSQTRFSNCQKICVCFPYSKSNDTAEDTHMHKGHNRRDTNACVCVYVCVSLHTHTHRHTHTLHTPPALTINKLACSPKLQPEVWSSSPQTHTLPPRLTLTEAGSSVPSRARRPRPSLLPVQDVIAGRGCGSQQS